jgi:glycosyltransferase involved in cell wall biosynthesis
MSTEYRNGGKRKISACMIAKNEENNIQRCIESYYNIVNEIIVVDTGSTDKTVEIAKKFGAKVIHFEWQDDFSAAKNRALEEATGDWILFLDADEFFYEDCQENIPKAILEAERIKKNVIACPMINTDGLNGAVLEESYSLRILKKGFHYRYPIHEAAYRKEGLKILEIPKDKIKIVHTGYNQLFLEEKLERNLGMLLNGLENIDESRKTINFYYIGECYFALKDHENAIKYTELYFQNTCSEYLYGVQSKPYRNLIESLIHSNADRNRILSWIDKMEEKFPGHPDAVFLRGLTCYNYRLFQLALTEFCRTAVLMKSYEGIELCKIAHNPTRVALLTGGCYEALKNTADAFSTYYQIFDKENDNINALLLLLNLTKNLPESEKTGFIESLYKNSGKARHKTVMTGLALYYMSPQLLKCFAAYKRNYPDEQFLYYIAGFLKAGDAQFDTAAKLLAMDECLKIDKLSRVKALICAVLADNREYVDKLSKTVEPEYAFALGIIRETDPDKCDINKIAVVICEIYRMRQELFAFKIISGLAENTQDIFMIKVALILEKFSCYQGALLCTEYAPENAGTYFLRGYYKYRLGYLSEAYGLFELAGKQGCSDIALEAYLEYIRQLPPDKQPGENAE